MAWLLLVKTGNWDGHITREMANKMYAKVIGSKPFSLKALQDNK